MDAESNHTQFGQGQGQKTAEILLRRENSTTNQRALKEKFVVVYEALFNGEDPSAGNPNFWDEVLLLKVNATFLDRCIILTAEDKLISLKNNISMIFIECAKAITDPFLVRKQHALETLTVLMRSIFRKKFTDFGGEVTTILCGSMDRADVVFTDLLKSVQVLLDSQAPDTPTDDSTTSNISMAVINLLLVIVTAVDNINQNTLYEYFLKVDLFPSFTKAITGGQLATEQSFLLIVLIVVLANYQKNEANNIYLHHLKHVDDPVILKAFTTILSDVWANVNKDNTNAAVVQEPNAGMWYKLGSYVSSFIYKQPEPTSSGLNAGPCLIVLYELIYLNPHFVKSLIPPRVPSSPRVSQSPRASNPIPVDPAGAHTYNKSVGVALIQQFLSFCTHVFSECNDSRSQTYAKLCLLILTCMSENNQLEEFFHDPTSAGSFTYSKATGPVDKTVISNTQPQVGQGLACVVLDALNLFMKQNMKKKFDLDMYRRCVGVVHRVLSYEKRTSTRLAYKWKDMWNTLFVVMKQSIGAPSESGIVGTGGSASGNVTPPTTATPPTATPGAQHLSKQQLGICLQVVTVLNLFITYGDSFLPSPSDYDDLYYEIMRVSKLLDHFYTMAEKQEHAPSLLTLATPQPISSDGTTDTLAPETSSAVVHGGDVALSRSSGEITTSALATLSMLNIKTIITHFSGKVQQWSFAHPEVALTPDVVLRIIKDNYDSLKLKLQENLDFYEEYVETTETPFFRHLTRTVIQDIKTNRVAS